MANFLYLVFNKPKLNCLLIFFNAINLIHQTINQEYGSVKTI
jgi:hypothetical protein